MKPDFADWHVLRKNWDMSYMLVLEWFSRRNYCIVDYVDHDFELYTVTIGLSQGTYRLWHDTTQG